jgi:Peptidase M50B-like
VTEPVPGPDPGPASPAGRGVVLFWVVLAAVVAGRLGGPLGGWTRAVGTATHEVGHAAAADVLAGDVLGVTVFPDGGGLTVTDAPGSGWRRFLVSGAGYPAPLLVAMVLLTGVLLGANGRRLAGAGAAAATLALVLWVPRRPVSPLITDADQRHTAIVFLVLVVLLAGLAALPDRLATIRRVALGVLAVGLLTDAFRSADDLLALTEEGGQRGTTDADGLAAVVDVGSAGTWAWLMRLFLLALFVAWCWWLFGRWATAPTVPTAAPAPERGGE